jgi:hypothetical protein
MAARLNLKHQDWVKAKIMASQLINRLQKHALGDREIMTVRQLQAAKILLAKTLPDLARGEVTGAEGGSVIVLIRPTVGPATGRT